MLKKKLTYLIWLAFLLGHFCSFGQDLNQRYYYDGPLWQDFRKVLPYSDTTFFVATQSWAPADLSSYQTQVGIVNKKGELLNESTAIVNIIQNFMSIGDINFSSDNELIIGGSILGQNMILKLQDGSIEWSKALATSPLNLTLNDYFAETSTDNFLVGGHRVEGDYGFLTPINAQGIADTTIKINNSDSLSSIKSLDVHRAINGGYYVVTNQNRTDLISFWDSYFNILKLNDTLGVEWNRSYFLESESDFSEVYGFVETTDQLVLTGRHENEITLLYFDHLGNPESAKKLSVGADELAGWGMCVLPKPTGGYLIGTGVPSPNSANEYQSILMDVTNSGSVNWARKYNPGLNASFAKLQWMNDSILATGRVVSNEANLGFWLTTKEGYEDCIYEDITEDITVSNTIIQDHTLYPVIISTIDPFEASNAFLSTRSDSNPQDSSCTFLNNVVYPGDVNFDQVANLYDLLPIGVFYNSTSSARPNATTDWVGQWSEDWGNTQISTADIKHVDTDGNGIINANDVEALDLNYTKTHTSTLRKEENLSLPGGPEIFIDFPENVPEAIEFTSEVVFGTEDNPTQDVYGICFVLDYSVSPVPIADISFSPDPNWLGTSDSVLLIVKHLEDEKRLEIGMVKNTGNNERIAFGPIGTVYIVTEDNILGRPISEEIIIDIIDIKVISNDETVLPASARSNQTVVTGIKETLLNNYFQVFPNPAKDRIQVQQPTGGSAIEKITLIDANGQKMLEAFDSNELQISHLPKGMYWVEISSEKGIGYYKLVKD